MNQRIIDVGFWMLGGKSKILNLRSNTQDLKPRLLVLTTDF